MNTPIDFTAKTINDLSRGYVEAQLHNGVTIADIEEVVFRREPDAALRKALDKKEIPWRIVSRRD